jgi:8-oxo-dGTP diphosphatase
MKLMTLCYIQEGDKTLMLHRINKPDKKWNGLGGKFEQGESPEDCVRREVKEESGLDIKNPILKGIMTFPNFINNEDFYVFVYVANEFSGNLITECPEGYLEWKDTDKLIDLDLWEDDQYFLPLLKKNVMFSAKFIYKDGKIVDKEIKEY